MNPRPELPTEPRTATGWTTLDLGDGGRSLIEASAGTGKTWTIAVLYLRLVLEHGLPPRRIVAATFTDAAAQELRDRLRAKLQWALAQAASEPSAEPAPDEDWLRQRWTTNATTRERDIDTLHLAISQLDQAPIGTLHGLCRRILADYPFASGALFSLGELADDKELREEVADDLWRRLQQSGPEDALVARQRKLEPDLGLGTLKQRLKRCLAPGVAFDLSEQAQPTFRIDPEWAARLRRITGFDEHFIKNSVLRRCWDELACFIENPEILPSSDALNRLKEATNLTGISKGGKNLPEIIQAAEFSEQCAHFIQTRLIDLPRKRLWRDLAAWAREQMDERLRARHQLSFDDLLARVSAALDPDPLDPDQQATARDLADALFTAWPVALVDEFQDTDGVQFGILDAIYRNADGSPRGRLVMIGDPKQAIYRFRGGDIHAYQCAADQAGEHLTLGVNHRSSRALVAAFNQFYGVGGEALGTQENQPIHYRNVEPGARRDGEPLFVDGKECTKPLQIHLWREPPGSASERRDAALDACASHIVHLLGEGTTLIAGKPLQPSDIAVLLPTNRDIANLAQRLRERGVPCVATDRRSVFETDAARELQVLLHAIAHPEDAGAVRAAAATSLIGITFEQLLEWEEHPAGWQALLEDIRHLHRVWNERGVQAVVSELISERIASRVLATPIGERVLTDLRHLGELLQTRAAAASGMEELLAWFGDCRNGENDAEASEETRLRIESDRPRLRLTTLHASKGLEFPIVLLPLMWAHGERADRMGLYLVNDEATGQRLIDVSEAARAAERQDDQDERFRVLYVALTRAIHACHVYALPPDRPRQGNSKKPAEGTERSALDVMLQRIEALQLAPDALQQRTTNIRWLSHWPEITSSTCTPAITQAPRQRSARPMPQRSTGLLEGKYSFTTLTRFGPQGLSETDTPADDERDHGVEPLPDVPTAIDAPTPSTEPHPELLRLSAVRGVDIGNAIHAIFEHRQIGVPLARQRDLIVASLDAANVRRERMDRELLIDALTQRLQAALDTDLRAGDGSALQLSTLSSRDLRAEMEFTFALDAVALDALHRACAAHGEANLVPVRGKRITGLLTGKIDLVFRHEGRFHVLDYKGNHLGERLADYVPHALCERMDEHHYRFQALLYTIALDRYLRQRLRNAYRRKEHLGECFYLFVRAAGLAPGAGVWRHRFDDGLLDAVAAVFAGDAREDTA